MVRKDYTFVCRLTKITLYPEELVGPRGWILPLRGGQDVGVKLRRKLVERFDSVGNRVHQVQDTRNELELFYLGRRWSFGALFNFEADTITFRKAPKTLTFDGAMVNKAIFSVFSRDKSVTLLIVEPLYCTLRHNFSNPFILLAWTLRHTGEWWEIFQDLTPDQYIQEIKGNPLLQP